MKLYVVMNRNAALLDRNLTDWIGRTLEDGVIAFARRRDAQRTIDQSGHPYLYRVVKFEASPGQRADARRKREAK